MICFLVLVVLVVLTEAKFWYMDFRDTPFVNPFTVDSNLDGERDFDCRVNGCIFPSNYVSMSNGWTQQTGCLSNSCPIDQSAFDTWPRYRFPEDFFVNLTVRIGSGTSGNEII